MKTALSIWLVLAGLMMSHVGCCSVGMMGNGCGVQTCGSGNCDSGNWGIEPCGLDNCGDANCGSCRQIEIPFSGVGRRMVNRVKNAHCSSGCGEIYWDEHINDPPVCDPCGCNGEFTGERCGSCPTALGRLRNLWGHRYYPSGNDGCSSCSRCSSGTAHESSMHGRHLQESNSHPASPDTNFGSPAPARNEPTPATPRVQTLPEAETVAPAPDPNAMRRSRAPARQITTGQVPASQVTIGSGITLEEENRLAPPKRMPTVKAKPVSHSVPMPRRLVTNPR